MVLIHRIRWFDLLWAYAELSPALPPMWAKWSASACGTVGQKIFGVTGDAELGLARVGESATAGGEDGLAGCLLSTKMERSDGASTVLRRISEACIGVSANALL